MRRLQTQQHCRRMNARIQTLDADFFEPEHAPVKIDVARVDLDQNLGAVMNFDRVYAGDMEDRSEDRIGAHRFRDRELGELAQLSAFAAQLRDLIRIETS